MNPPKREVGLLDKGTFLESGRLEMERTYRFLQPNLSLSQHVFLDVK